MLVLYTVFTIPRLSVIVETLVIVKKMKYDIFIEAIYNCNQNHSSGKVVFNEYQLLPCKSYILHKLRFPAHRGIMFLSHPVQVSTGLNLFRQKEQDPLWGHRRETVHQLFTLCEPVGSRIGKRLNFKPKFFFYLTNGCFFRSFTWCDIARGKGGIPV